MIELLLIGVVLLVAMSKQFNGGGQFGNSMSVLRFRLATSYIEFKTAIGVGLGGVKRVDRTGITTVTDAGAAGASVVYNPTNGNLSMGTVDYYYVVNLASSRVDLGSGGSQISVSGIDGVIREYVGGLLVDYLNGGGRVAAGWLLAKGVHSQQRNDTPPQTEVPGAGGSIAWINARGGVRRLTSIAAADYTVIHNNACDWISLQDGPRCLQRWAVHEFDTGTPNALMTVGWRDFAGNNGFDLRADAAIGANWQIASNRGGGTTVHDTGVAVVVGEYIRVSVDATPAGVVTVYINDALVHTVAAADAPVVTTLMEEWAYVRPVIPAIMARLDLDIMETVLSRNPAVTA